MKRLISLIFAGALLLSLAITATFLVWNNTSPPVKEHWKVSGDQTIPDGALTVRFTGTTTLLFSDGETSWMTDGWFSRPPLIQFLVGKIRPDTQAIMAGLAANNVKSLAAIIPLHSHYDHAMDAPEVARLTGATLMGSGSTANIGLGWGLGIDQIEYLQDFKTIALGKFSITPVEFAHYEFPRKSQNQTFLKQSNQIEHPLTPPVKATDYRVGKTYALHVRHPKGTFTIVGSAGHLKGKLTGLQSDMIFLSLGGLGSQTGEYRETYWKETVTTTGATTIIPVHYDNLTAPISGEFRGPGPLLHLLGAANTRNTLAFLDRKESENSDLRFIALPRFEEVILFQ